MNSGLEIAIYTALAAFAISIAVSPFMIPALTRLKIGQNVRDDGPQTHLSKSGTPKWAGFSS